MEARNIGRIVVGTHIFGPKQGSRKVVEQIEYDHLGIMLTMAVEHCVQQVIAELSTGTWFVNIHGSTITFDGEKQQKSFPLSEEVVPYLNSEQLDMLSLGLGSIASKIDYKTQVELFQSSLKATL